MHGAGRPSGGARAGTVPPSACPVRDFHPLTVQTAERNVLGKAFEHQPIRVSPRFKVAVLHAFGRDVIGRGPSIFGAGAQLTASRLIFLRQFDQAIRLLAPRLEERHSSRIIAGWRRQELAADGIHFADIAPSKVQYWWRDSIHSWLGNTQAWIAPVPSPGIGACGDRCARKWTDRSHRVRRSRLDHRILKAAFSVRRAAASLRRAVLGLLPILHSGPDQIPYQSR